MLIHSNLLSYSDLSDTLRQTGLVSDGVFISGEHFAIKGSRSHDQAMDVRLRGYDGQDREGTTRRLPMFAWKTGEDMKAATYHEWGVFLAEVFDRDPNALVAGTYKGRDDFHTKTKHAFA